ncbi:uncharacterized protein M6B38_166775 [Iris pallida]|uniref:Uncharacterized protein n=1 Tax=Iris pallida TaxID=29817 RepID=A0AAX6EX05_IRIPA|nr:uncharacterized protein M6B38_166775 [Iris pallida]
MDFWGDEGIVYADEWLENAERTLRMANISDDTKVEVASMRLFDLARAWYGRTPSWRSPMCLGQISKLCSRRSSFQK